MAATTRQKSGWITANLVTILLVLIPVVWIASLSFKEPSTITDPTFFPKQWTWANYKGIFTSSEFTRPLLNSIGIGLIATLISVVLASLAAYAVARLAFPGKRVLVGLSLLIAMFPLISLATPLFNIERQLGIFNTWIGLIIPYIAFGLPLGIYTLSAFFREIPWELEKAAKMDGATPFQAFIRVPTGSISAAAVVITIPIIIFVLFFQRRIVAGLTSGAVKG
jgi:trehalose/maltose transport system permease protein